MKKFFILFVLSFYFSIGYFQDTCGDIGSQSYSCWDGRCCGPYDFWGYTCCPSMTICGSTVCVSYWVIIVPCVGGAAIIFIVILLIVRRRRRRFRQNSPPQQEPIVNQPQVYYVQQPNVDQPYQQQQYGNYGNYGNYGDQNFNQAPYS